MLTMKDRQRNDGCIFLPLTPRSPTKGEATPDSHFFNGHPDTNKIDAVFGTVSVGGECGDECDDEGGNVHLQQTNSLPAAGKNTG